MMAGSKQNFFVDHYDWMVALVGILLLVGVGVLFASTLDDTPEDALAKCKQELKANKPAYAGVAPANLALLDKALTTMSSPSLLELPDEKKGNFLASEGRVFCKSPECHRPIPTGSKVCPFCKFQQPSDKPVDVVRHGNDADKDGMPDAWETKYGLNPNDPDDAKKDSDGDTFTNLEEFIAKTDPTNPDDHPDFLDDLKIKGDLRKEMLPFWFKMANPIRNGYRMTFAVPGDGKYRNITTALEGEEIVFQLAKPKFVKGRMMDDKVKSGWRVVKYNKIEKSIVKSGAEQATRVDVSTVDLERVSDKRKISARVGVQSVAVEEQIDLQWNRIEGKSFCVTNGSEFSLGEGKAERKYKVKKLAKGSVTIIDLKTKAEKILR